MASTEEIQHVVKETGADWRTAAGAVMDAEKALKPKAKGVKALGKGPTREAILAKALELMKEPARRPENIAAINALKKELKLPVAKVRKVVVECDYDFDRARALLGPAAAAKSGAKTKKKKKVTGLKRVFRGGYARGDDIVLELNRRKTLKPNEKRIQKELHRNGEYVGHVDDRCLVRRTAAGWERVTPFFTDFVAYAIDPNGRLVYVTNHQRARDKGGGFFCRVTIGDEKHDIDGIARTLVVGDSGVLLKMRSHVERKDFVLCRTGADWTPADFPSTDQTLAGADGGLWVSTYRALFRRDGDEWVEVPHEPMDPPPVEYRPFAPVVIGPNGALAARRIGLWTGSVDAGLSVDTYGDGQHLAYVRDALVFDRDGGLYWRDGANDRRIREPAKPARNGKVPPPKWFASDARLFAISSLTLEEWIDDEWKSSHLDGYWDAIAYDEPLWVKHPPEWLPG
jgi:hypothetical protein